MFQVVPTCQSFGAGIVTPVFLVVCNWNCVEPVFRLPNWVDASEPSAAQLQPLSVCKVVKSRCSVKELAVMLVSLSVKVLGARPVVVLRYCHLAVEYAAARAARVGEGCPARELGS